jgi:hypothetical protein
MGSGTLAPCRHAPNQEDREKTPIEGESPQGCGPKSVLFLCRTEIEMVLGLVFTVAWGGEYFGTWGSGGVWRERGRYPSLWKTQPLPMTVSTRP